MNEIKLVYNGDVLMGNIWIRFAHVGDNGGRLTHINNFNNRQNTKILCS